jgi:hypothetical protein
MQQIYYYKLYRFSSKDEDDYIELTQEQGQKLSIILASDPNRKFILIGDDVINTSSIERLVKCNQTTTEYDNRGIAREKLVIRKLTPEEEKIQRQLDEFKGRKLLNN